MVKKTKRFQIAVKAFLVAAVTGISNFAFAGSGIGGINAAQTELSTYIDPVSNLILVIGDVVGLVGGVRVYIKWNAGDPDVNKEIMGWMGSCVFLVVVSIVIKAFFT